MSCKAVSNRAVATMFSLYVMLLLFSECLYLKLACMLCKFLFFDFSFSVCAHHTLLISMAAQANLLIVAVKACCRTQHLCFKLPRHNPCIAQGFFGKAKIRMQKALCKSETIFQIYLDLRKAYDSINCPGVLALMKKYQVGPRICKYVAQIWSTQEFFLRELQENLATRKLRRSQSDRGWDGGFENFFWLPGSQIVGFPVHRL